MKNIVTFRTFEERDIPFFYKWKNDDNLSKMSVGLNKKVCYSDVEKWVRSKMPHNPYEAY